MLHFARIVSACVAACPPCAPCLTADWTGDGYVDCDDYAAYWSDRSVGAPCADLDDGSGSGTPDGIVDHRDDNYFSNLWSLTYGAWILNPCHILDRVHDGVLNCADLNDYLDRFNNGEVCADLTDGSGQPYIDGGVTKDDLIYFDSVLQSPTPVCAGRPANDSCATPQPVATGLYSFNNCMASTGPQGQGNAFGGLNGVSIPRDVWFLYTPTQACTTTITTSGLTTIQAKIAVYAGSCPASISSALACSGNVYSPDATVTFTPVPNTPYLIQLGVRRETMPGQLDPWGGSGLVRISQAPPSNDSCATPQSLACPTFGGPIVVNYSSLGCATTDGAPENSCAFPINALITNDLWYSVTIPSNLAPGITLKASSCTADDDRMAVYDVTGPCPSPGVVVACGDTGASAPCAPGGAGATFGAVAGRTYLIRIGNGPGAHSSGTLKLERLSTATCNPALQTRAYRISGCGNGQAWSWAIRASAGVKGNLSVAGVGAPPAAPGPCPPSTATAFRVALTFCTDINRTNGGCGGAATMLTMACPGASPGVNCAWFSVRAPTPFDLYVGPPGAPSCLATNLYASGGASCVFNPEIVEIPLEELDGDADGVPDYIQIQNGTLHDVDGSGIADEFETPACDPDMNQDGNVNQDDVVYLINVIAGGDNPSGIDPDFDLDGNVSQDDVVALINAVAGGGCP